MKTEEEIVEILLRNAKTIDTFCRICLTENMTNYEPLFEAKNKITLSEKIMMCARVQLNDNVGLPRIICNECAKELNIADSFRMKCEYYDVLLRKVYLHNLVKYEPDTEEIKFVDSVKHESVTRVLTSKTNDSHEPNKSVNGVHKKKSRKKFSKKKIKYQCSDDDIDIKIENPIENEYEDGINFDFADDAFNHEAGGNVCHICNKPLCNEKGLQRHLKSMHSEKRKRKFGTVSGYGVNRRYHCSECAYSTPRSQNLVYHARTHTGEKPYECSVCSKSFTQPKTLNSHMKTHSDTMHYTCSECGKQFKHREVYVRHRNSHTDTNSYPCEICNKQLKSLDTLKAHMNRHYNIKNFNCELCGNMFVTKVELINHSKQHSSEKNFCCSVCEYRTNVKKNLEKHTVRHLGVRRYKCNLCDHACFTSSDLKLHQKKHTKEKDYKCPLCDIRFSRTTSVNRHMLKFHGIKYKRVVDRRFIK